MTLDTRKIRAAAEAATPEFARTIAALRECVRFYVVHCYEGPDGTEATLSSDGPVAALLNLVETLSPSTVIAMVDQIETLQEGHCLGLVPDTFVTCGEGLNFCSKTCEVVAQNNHAASENLAFNIKVSREINDLRSQLAAMTAARGSLADIAEDLRVAVDRADAWDADSLDDDVNYKTKIAEFRKVGVAK